MLAGSIEFINVCFTYPGNTERTLQNFNMLIPAGKKVGLLGHIGCGKTTIINLLLGLYKIDSGEILIDGVNIDQYDLKSLRKQVGYVMQQPILFNISIKDNIKFGAPGSSASKIFQVAEAANTLSFIESNYEELSAEEQLDETRKQIRHFAIHRL